MSEFRDIIIKGEATASDFLIGDFVDIIIDIPSEFLNAAWGYGRHNGRFYGHT